MSGITERMLFKLATAGFAIGLVLCGWVVGYAQSGPDWEVPQAIVTGLVFALGTALMLSLIGIGIAARTGFYSNLPSGARRAHFVFAVIVFLLPLIIWAIEPSQWVIRSPELSRIAALLPIPSFILAAVLYWLIAIRALDRFKP